MVVFERMIAALERMDRGMPTAVKASLQEPFIETQIMDLNVEQMNAGQESTGDAIWPPYAPLTIEIKKVKGQPWDKVTLRDEGDFQRAIDIDWGTDDFFIFSHDEKYTELIRKYGLEIFGLNDKNLAYIRGECLPSLLSYVRDQIAKR